MTTRPPFAPGRSADQIRAQAMAKQWESRLQAWHAEYLTDGRANVERHHEGMRKVGGRWIKSEDGAPDFGGTLRGGRSVVFDAKLVLDEGLLYWSKVKPHQRTSLMAHARLGGVAMVLVRFVEQSTDAAFLVVDPMPKVLRYNEGVRMGDGGWYPAVRWALGHKEE